MPPATKTLGQPRSILVVSETAEYRDSLAREFRLRGIEVKAASTRDEARAVASSFGPEAAVVDLRTCDEVDMCLIVAVKEASPGTKIAVLLPYRSMTIATRAGNLGAACSVEKPAQASMILAAIQGTRISVTAVRDLAQIERAHIKRVLADCDGNISEAARILGIDRRTLRRKLGGNENSE